MWGKLKGKGPWRGTGAESDARNGVVAIRSGGIVAMGERDVVGITSGLRGEEEVVDATEK